MTTRRRPRRDEALPTMPYLVPYVGRPVAPVKKTSVYLPEGLKARLAAVALRSGRSEAQLVRLAVERLVDSEPPQGSVGRAEDPVVRRHRRAAALVGLGMGPGDPGLVTARTVVELRAADRVLAPSTDLASVGRAEIIVREVAPDVVVERVGFVMELGGGARSKALAAAAERVVSALDAGERVAFVTLGDPNVYSTFSSLADEVRARRPDVPIETVPGIMAFQDLAARAGTVLVDGDERLVLVPARAGSDPTVLAAAVADPSAALVVYKGGGRLPEVARLLADAGRLDGAVLGELLGLPGGRVAAVADVAGQPATYLATVVVPPVRTGSAAARLERPNEREGAARQRRTREAALKPAGAGRRGATGTSRSEQAGTNGPDRSRDDAAAPAPAAAPGTESAGGAGGARPQRPGAGGHEAAAPAPRPRRRRAAS